MPRRTRSMPARFSMGRILVIFPMPGSLSRSASWSDSPAISISPRPPPVWPRIGAVVDEEQMVEAGRQHRQIVPAGVEASDRKAVERGVVRSRRESLAGFPGFALISSIPPDCFTRSISNMAGRSDESTALRISPSAQTHQTGRDSVSFTIAWMSPPSSGRFPGSNRMARMLNLVKSGVRLFVTPPVPGLPAEPVNTAPRYWSSVRYVAMGGVNPGIVVVHLKVVGTGIDVEVVLPAYVRVRGPETLDPRHPKGSTSLDGVQGNPTMPTRFQPLHANSTPLPLPCNGRYLWPTSDGAIPPRHRKSGPPCPARKWPSRRRPLSRLAQLVVARSSA